PVVFLKNVAGQFVKADSLNVAVALTKARFNADHTQVLDDVYTNPDPRTYPLSSYSYMIAPTQIDPNKGSTLGKFILYFLCEGQRSADTLGYSPLPPVLVQDGFDAVSHIQGAPTPPSLDDCNNPTIGAQWPPPLSGSDTTTTTVAGSTTTVAGATTTVAGPTTTNGNGQSPGTTRPGTASGSNSNTGRTNGSSTATTRPSGRQTATRPSGRQTQAQGQTQPLSGGSNGASSGSPDAATDSGS